MKLIAAYILFYLGHWTSCIIVRIPDKYQDRWYTNPLHWFYQKAMCASGDLDTKGRIWKPVDDDDFYTEDEDDDTTLFV